MPSSANNPKHEMEKSAIPSPEKMKSSNNHVIWDCGSSLYDSFERNEFQKQLDSALSARTLSMPHLSDRRRPPPLNKKPPSKISRSFQRLIRAVFKPKTASRDSIYEEPKRGYFDTIPEFDVLMSPEIRRTSSARFASSGITCS